MSDKTTLGDRMKRYEHTFRQTLPRRTYTLMRLDGRAFHTYLKGARKPFDHSFMECMNLTAMRLCEEIQGARFAYVQSDEISILITDFDTEQTEPWFGGVTAKLTSLSAGLASAYFMRMRGEITAMPTFDSRVWCLSDPVEVANYFLWRQRDAVRNSIQMVGQTYFSPAELFEKSTDDIQEMLFTGHRVNWNDFAAGAKRGRMVFRDRTGWIIIAAPNFVAEPDNFLAEVIPQLPTLSEK